MPPKAKAVASTMGTEVPANQPALTMLSIHVVSAKPVRPSGAGLASFMGRFLDTEMTGVVWLLNAAIVT